MNQININKSSIFIRLKDFIDRKVKITTSYKVYEGLLSYVDSEGNISIRLESGLAFIQRKYVVGIEVMP